MKKSMLILAVLMLSIMSTGCVGEKVRKNLHTKVDQVELKTKVIVEENIDQVVVDILKKLDSQLKERGIELPPDLKEILVAEAQKLAREYAIKGVEVGFDELHKLIDELIPPAPVVE